MPYYYNTTLHINGREILEKDFLEESKKYDEIRLTLKKGDYVLIRCPDSWYVKSNGKIRKVLSVTPCYLCGSGEPNSNRGKYCPGYVKLEGEPDQSCWGFGGKDQMFAIFPVKKSLTYIKK